jgi:hypothetical protein
MAYPPPQVKAPILRKTKNRETRIPVLDFRFPFSALAVTGFSSPKLGTTRFLF